MVAGTVETMLERTVYAAVATAASFEADGSKRVVADMADTSARSR
jgi:hypothetical protein